MANRRYQGRTNPNKKSDSGRAPDTGHSRQSGPGISMRNGTCAWPGIPGKSQPRSRSSGIRVVKGSVKSEGIEA